MTDLDISDIGIGPTGARRVADYVRDAKASLTKVVITGAVIGEDDVAVLRSAAQTGCEVVW